MGRTLISLYRERRTMKNIALLSLLTLASTRTSTISWNGKCVRDSGSRLLPTLPRTDLTFPSLTPAKCMEACQDQGFLFAGVQYGHECWCGNDAPPEDRIVDMAECDYSCSGDSSQTCGGYWRMNVYKIAAGLALIISGGSPIDSAGISVEVFVPSTGQHCQLPSLPGGPRSDHSINDRTICGGGVYNVYSASRRSCLTLNSNGNWLETTSLLEQRYHHSSWASPSGLILMGGRGSKRTTEKIEADGTSTYSFELKYDIDLACSINLGSTVVITGDRHDQTRVTQYSEAGFSRDLPQLQQGRYNHGCSYFNNQDGTRTLLVSGGYGLGEDNFNNYLLSSTELLVESASTWVYSGELPSPGRVHLRGINIDDKILMTGGYTTGDDSIISDEILEFDSLTGQWKIVDRMIQTRGAHAMAAIDFDPGLCTNPPTTEPPTTAEG